MSKLFVTLIAFSRKSSFAAVVKFFSMSSSCPYFLVGSKCITNQHYKKNFTAVAKLLFPAAKRRLHAYHA